MKTLTEYIKICEGIFDTQDITFKDFKLANSVLEIVNVDKPLTQDKAELEKIYFNTDLKLEDGSTVKDNVNNNKADFKKYGLSNYIEGSNSNDMKALLAKHDKADKEIGDDTFSTQDGNLLVRNLKLENGQIEPMAIVLFKLQQ